MQKEHPLVAASAGIRLAVHGEDAFESLGLKLPAGTTRLAHIFDTDDGILLRDGYLLQLLEEPGAFAVAVTQGEETQVVKIDARWAADILDGSLSPITVLERRLGRQLLPDTGKQPLRRVSWRKRLRRHLVYRTQQSRCTSTSTRSAVRAAKSITRSKQHTRVKTRFASSSCTLASSGNLDGSALAGAGNYSLSRDARIAEVQSTFAGPVPPPLLKVPPCVLQVGLHLHI